MKFIKKFGVVIFLGLLFLLGGGLLLFGSMRMGEVRKQMSQVESAYKKAVGLGQKVVPDAEVKLYSAKVQEIQQEVDNFKDLAKNTTARPLISHEVFPKPPRGNIITPYQRFGGGYRRMVDGYLNALQAGLPPTLQEMAERTRQTEEDAKARGITGDKLREQIEELLKDDRIRRAQELKVYASTESFMGYAFWNSVDPGSSQLEALQQDSWFTQISHWVQEDVVQAVAAMNQQSNSVIDAPIKRLLEVSFGGENLRSTTKNTAMAGHSLAGHLDTAVGRRAGPGSVNRLPGYVRAGPTGALVNQLTDSWTGRASDSLIHVVQFEVGVIMEVTQLNDFINELQSEKYTFVMRGSVTVPENKRNQITVLQVIQEPLDRQAELEAGYYYGSGAVAVVRLIGEYYFFKDGYMEFMPEPVKTSLQPAPATGM